MSYCFYFTKNTLKKLTPFSQNITPDNFEEIAFRIFDCVRQDAMNLRHEKDRGIGGCDGEIRIVLAAAAQIPIERDYYTMITRHPKNDRISKLRKIYENNDVEGLCKVLFDIERSVAYAKIDFRDSPLLQDESAESCDPHSEDEIESENPFAEVYCSPSGIELYIPDGNTSRRKDQPRKPKEREVRSLFEEPA